ncbi:cobyrinate a,c-diamide synthase [Aureimonas sp. ME7]|uniref:cobyrinate a,c-diamide synthase n=1 Tax=Aureimonas sp. ME7 TaxID=2744252 RepID=UPI0015F5BEEF|nr:cobyrinate a,c-diamide synthase [Aureimonas sp. ME7]
MTIPNPSSGLLVAAPRSGSGKTLFTLALLRWARGQGLRVAPAKAGPDYIDPGFHAHALGQPSVNLDPHAMRPALIRSLAATDGRPLVVEGMMGLFDGAADGSGSSADLAVLLRLPVVLVVDCAKQSHSVAALVRGFRDHRGDVHLAGVVLNRVGSPRHEAMLRGALESLGVRVLGALPNAPDLALPERHLGLVPAGEHGDLDRTLDHAAAWFAGGMDLAVMEALLAPRAVSVPPTVSTLPPLGRRVAVARDEAFAFLYPHLLAGWRAAGTELALFSPLADEGPEPGCDAVFLPGGYPELHAGRIAAASGFRAGMEAARNRGAAIYGECGGYMVLGESLEDAQGIAHPMLGFLPLRTSFRRRRLHLGYRRLRPLSGAPWAAPLAAHEFHYSTVSSEGEADRLFAAIDALGEDLGVIGLRRERVSGSYAHVIDLA